MRERKRMTRVLLLAGAVLFTGVDSPAQQEIQLRFGMIFSSAGGWGSSRPETVVRSENGELAVESTLSSYWIRTAEPLREHRGLFVIEFEVMVTQPGEIRIYPSREGKPYAPGDFVSIEIEQADIWVPVELTVPGRGVLDSIRINLPTGSGSGRLRRIRLKNRQGTLIESWFETPIPAIVG